MKKRNRHSVKRNLARDEGEVPYPSEKTCSKCKIVKSAVDFFKSKRENDGLKSYCKCCGSIKQREYYRKNSAKQIVSVAAWQVANPDKVRANARKTYYKNHESRKARLRSAYQANKEKIGEQFREKYNSDPEMRLAIQEKVRRRYEIKAEAIKAYQKNYRKQNPEKAQVWTNNRRLRIKQAEGVCTPEQWLEILDYYGYCCAYCLKRESEVGRMTMDHVIAISDGGTNNPDNLVPACRSCNCSKNDKTLLEYLAFRARVDRAA